jgi:hypothetical protein
MAGNKKSRKAYRPRDVIRPLNMRDPWLIEGDTHAALLAIEAGTCTEDHYAMLCAHADIVRRMYQSGPEHSQAETIIRMIGISMERGRMTPAEEVAIRAAVKVTLHAVQKARNRQIMDATRAAYADISRHGGVRMVL